MTKPEKDEAWDRETETNRRAAAYPILLDALEEIAEGRPSLPASEAVWEMQEIAKDAIALAGEEGT